MKDRFSNILACGLILAAISLAFAGCRHKKEEPGNGKPGAGQAAKPGAQGTQAQGNCPAGMSYVKAGAFSMGCSEGDALCRGDEKPARVTLTKNFCMDTREVTQGDYEKTKKKNPSFFKQCGPDCPVEQVIWTDAQSYCEMRGGRLPTEAEWEYAARGGAATRFYWGGAVDANYAWYADDSAGATHPVAKKQPNAYGLHDMLGNVWEWTSDIYGEYPAAPGADPKGAEKGDARVIRGGAFSNNEGMLRVSSRDKSRPGAYNRYIGFRCAKDAQ